MTGDYSLIKSKMIFNQALSHLFESHNQADKLYIKTQLEIWGKAQRTSARRPESDWRTI